MTTDQHVPAQGEVSFGPFTLRLADRQLLRDGAPIPLSTRALDILAVLVERSGELVSKRELLERVWTDVTVDEGALRFHMSVLRKALGDGQAGARYITTQSGRGYCFVSPVGRAVRPQAAQRESPVHERVRLLPARLTRMVGRDETIQRVTRQLIADRFISIVGPGGIGKSTVAVAVGHVMLAEFADDVCYVDLGALRDPLLVANAVASALGVLVRSQDAASGIVALLQDKRMLLILDSCEHVIETASLLAERIYQEALQVHILATSRESLRVEGEHVVRLAALESPPDDPGLAAEQILAFPAAQLFIERAVASGHRFDIGEADARRVGEICRRLDGIALAIELAAGRVNAFGIHETATLLDNRFRLQGRRTALRRHQTLGATLDWSYGLLPQRERLVFCRLAIFVGAFGLDDAEQVAAAGEITAGDVSLSLESLVEKSLVSADIRQSTTRYRLLETTRAYALGNFAVAEEADDVARRHAIHFLDFLERVRGQSPQMSPEGDPSIDSDLLGNVRTALEWCFSERGDTALGVALAAAAVDLFIQMSLLTECNRWAEQALAVLDDASRGTRREMDLHNALGLSRMFTRGNSEHVGSALTRGLELAEQLDDPVSQLRSLEGLHLFHVRTADFRNALAFAQRCEAVAGRLGDPARLAQARVWLGISSHLEGDSRSARSSLESALLHLPRSQDSHSLRFGFDYRNRARVSLARVLWLQGFPDQASNAARQAIDEAVSAGEPINLCMVLLLALTVFFWNGDLDGAEAQIERFILQADKHSLAPYQAIGRGSKGELLVRRGEVEAGIALLQAAAERLKALRYGLPTAVSVALTQGFTRLGRETEAHAAIDEAIALVDRNGDMFGMPELLRIKADLLASMQKPDLIQAEDYLVRSLELARRQAALAWELRTSTSLAQLWSGQGRPAEAGALLRPVLDRCTEGFESADHVAARRFAFDV